MRCIATRLPAPSPAGLAWHSPAWREIPAQPLHNHMGPRPLHFPHTEVQIAYDNAALHLRFVVADQYVRAVAAQHQESVWQDSCVEFFFTPGPDPAPGYFNLEINCGGIMLMHFQTRPREDKIEISRRECQQITVSHSLPRIVSPELESPRTWSVAYRLPLEIVERYCPLRWPAPGVSWRVNFYKCADHSSHPHWLTWAPVASATPNFHLPHFFGVLEFA